ncbi:hypothetical protein JTB14_018269 [Gonioctena quinquepunctata]|nr:hypothetical protein JTB14_018269 [Gonioctena quinquepunctata]
MNDYKKYNFIKNTWHPPRNHVLPFSEHNKNNRIVKRYLNHDHLAKYEWLLYSLVHKGLYCKFCVVFAQGSGRNKTECLKSLVQTAMTKFDKLFGKDGVLDIHDSNKYHKEAILRSNTFVNCHENPTFDIRNVLSEGRKRQVEENRKRLVPIIRCVIFLARQNIPFCGHRDDGELFNTSQVNEGNFRELLRFRIEAEDRVLEEHLRSTSSKATYISKTTQNQLIHFCSEDIISTIFTKIKSAQFYRIMFDETTDISHLSQMSLVIRYLQGREVKEDFVGFIDYNTEKYELDPDTMEPTERYNSTMEPVLTGKILGQIVSHVKKLNLPFMDCVGIYTEGCSVMTSKQNGAVQEAQKMLISAVRCPCLSHALNLSLSKSSSVQSVRNAMGVMKDVSFFTASSKIN